MSDRITKLREDFDIELKAVNTDEDAKALRDRWVGQGMATGKKGLILAEMKMLGSRPGGGTPNYDASEDSGTRPAAKAAAGASRPAAKTPGGITDMDDDIPF